ncbi:hypothetical protein H671_1g1670 [Cricetulus griseus]|nr:hypothetical protein H671_1g1670 [Cricetulus griseus]
MAILSLLHKVINSHLAILYLFQKHVQNLLLESQKNSHTISGPDYIKDHSLKVHQHTAYIGEKRPVREKTGDLRYLCRSAPNRSLPAKYKHQYVCGIGWGIPEFACINKSRWKSGFQAKLEDVAVLAIGKISHRYQNPCSPTLFDTQQGSSHPH